LDKHQVNPKVSEKAGKVSKVTKGKILMLNLRSMSTRACVVSVKNDLADCSPRAKSSSYLCTTKGEKVALSHLVENHLCLIGWDQNQSKSRLDRLK
jgi:translation initiation factor 2 subunit 3